MFVVEASSKVAELRHVLKPGMRAEKAIAELKTSQCRNAGDWHCMVQQQRVPSGAKG